MSGRPLELEFLAIDEPEPGEKWRAQFDAYWSAYERWFFREGDDARRSRRDSVRALRRHMPELMETYERLVDLAGGGDRAARFLALYCPPPIVAGCAQAVWTRGTPALVRNYDYAPHLCDGIVLRTAWSGRGSVVALTDCAWGVLDGMNADGLVVALSFGGRRDVGDGFAVPLILRYVLETCADVAGAVSALQRVPSYMSYNVTLVDAAGAFATVHLAPDRPAEVVRRRSSTNHQGRVEWPAYAKASATVERAERLETLLADPERSLDALADDFLAPPLYQLNYRAGRGTLYTAIYRPVEQRLELRWPGDQWTIEVAAFREGSFTVKYARKASGPTRGGGAGRASTGPGGEE